MKSYVVIGLGRFGRAVAEELCELGNEVLAIDDSEELVRPLADKVTHCVIADATNADVLRDLGVQDFDCAVVAIGSDIGTSALVTLNVKELGVPQIICKAMDHVHRRVLEKIGADQVIIPEHEMGTKLARDLNGTSVINFLELNQDYSLVEVPVPGGWVGKTILELNVRVNYQVNIIAVRGDGEEQMNVAPGAKHRFERKERVVVVGSNQAISDLKNA